MITLMYCSTKILRSNWMSKQRGGQLNSLHYNAGQKELQGDLHYSAPLDTLFARERQLQAPRDTCMNDIR